MISIKAIALNPYVVIGFAIAVILYGLCIIFFDHSGDEKERKEE